MTGLPGASKSPPKSARSPTESLLESALRKGGLTLVRFAVVTSLFAVALASITGPAHAAFPGDNGRIVYAAPSGATTIDLYSAEPNG